MGVQRWLLTSPLLSVPRRATWGVITRILATRNMKAVPASDAFRGKELALIRRVIAETDMLLLEDEAYQVLSCARATAKIAGEIAEVGVYRGGSARLICEVRGERALYLFDTFEGLPESRKVDALFQGGQYAAHLEQVQAYLARFPEIRYFKGMFPATSGPVADKRFSFVHLDVDLYQSTRDGLEFFYPRMNPGGIILIHDYLWAEGVRQAVDEFLAARPEPVLELAGAYCGIVKTTS